MTLGGHIFSTQSVIQSPRHNLHQLGKNPEAGERGHLFQGALDLFKVRALGIDLLELALAELLLLQQGHRLLLALRLAGTHQGGPAQLNRGFTIGTNILGREH